MKHVYADPSLKMNRNFFIQELMSFGVINDSNGNRISGLDYYSLRRLLAIEQIKRGDD